MRGDVSKMVMDLVRDKKVVCFSLHTFAHCLVVDVAVWIILIRSLRQRGLVLFQRFANHHGVLFRQETFLPVSVFFCAHLEIVPRFQFRSKCLQCGNMSVDLVGQPICI